MSLLQPLSTQVYRANALLLNSRSQLGQSVSDLGIGLSWGNPDWLILINTLLFPQLMTFQVQVWARERAPLFRVFSFRKCALQKGEEKRKEGYASF